MLQVAGSEEFNVSMYKRRTLPLNKSNVILQILLKLSPPFDKSEFKTGLLPTVLKRKNRNSVFIPRMYNYFRFVCRQNDV